MSLKAIPLLILALILYNAIVFVSSGTPDEIFYGSAVLDTVTNAPQRVGYLFQIGMPNGGTWTFWLGDLIMFIALVLLGLELIKATYTRGAGLADQALSVIVFVIFLVEFLLVERASSSLFFLLTVTSALDVIIGSIVGIRTARRDIGFGSADQ
ncbi:MAG: hypothetical protein R3D57_03625 [Hyphomicrobiaceae bacterium]